MKCPDCGLLVARSAAQCACGWRPGKSAEHAYRWASKVEGEWVDLQCAFNDYGSRCESAGALSPSTNGRGPWYCRQHFGPTGVKAYGEPGSADGWVKAKTAIRGVMREPGQDDE